MTDRRQRILDETSRLRRRVSEITVRLHLAANTAPPSRSRPDGRPAPGHSDPTLATILDVEHTVTLALDRYRTAYEATQDTAHVFGTTLADMPPLRWSDPHLASNANQTARHLHTLLRTLPDQWDRVEASLWTGAHRAKDMLVDDRLDRMAGSLLSLDRWIEHTRHDDGHTTERVCGFSRVEHALSRWSREARRPPPTVEERAGLRPCACDGHRQWCLHEHGCPEQLTDVSDGGRKECTRCRNRKSRWSRRAS